MTKLYIPLAALMLVLLAAWQPNPTTRYTLTEISTLWVTGTSTVHDWQCDAAQVKGWLDAEVGERVTGIPVAEISVPTALDCKNGTMDKKTRNALKADDHPNITFKLTKAEVVPGTGNAFSVKTTGQLTIAGVTNTVSTTVKGEMLANGNLQLTGTLPVTMSNHGVDPPTAMLGTLKTGDDVVVHIKAVAKPAK